ncbi:MAG: TIR domain-containing protein [Methanomassiliicoccus sp.]|nr:TIR domain-containing protein [Methanomassiliicoccus sp.]
MARKAFFSFHFERDIWRVCQIRNSWVTKPTIDEAGYMDAASWEAVKKSGDDAIRRWINNQLDGTSVTVVLFGKETYSRDWVRYEIERSIQKGNGFLAIDLNGLKDQYGNIDPPGTNPFYYFRDPRSVKNHWYLFIQRIIGNLRMVTIIFETGLKRQHGLRDDKSL